MAAAMKKYKHEVCAWNAYVSFEDTIWEDTDTSKPNMVLWLVTYVH